MPYITQDRREELAVTFAPETMGELNWLITSFIADYALRKGLSYQSIGEITAALVNAKDEFYRRVAAPYESKKCEENGDAYPEGLLWPWR